MDKISATIITLNEEARINDCLDSIEGIADEIIVIDSYSTDRTVEICESRGCRVVRRHFKGYGIQRQYATSLTTHSYVLSIDADELLSPALRQSLLKIKEEGFKHRVYSFSRLNFYCGQPIRHCGWYPNYQIRLFDKHYANWDLHDVGERVIFSDTLHAEPLDGDLLHYRCNTPEEYRRIQRRHSVIEAEVLVAKKQNTSAIRGFFKAIGKFMDCYIRKGGIFDGPEGRAISREHYYSTILAYKVARQMKRDKKKKE